MQYRTILLFETRAFKYWAFRENKKYLLNLFLGEYGMKIYAKCPFDYPFAFPRFHRLPTVVLRSFSADTFGAGRSN
jgi:hypothetical protein